MKSIGFKLNAIMLSVILFGIVVTIGVAMTISSNVITSETLDDVKNSTKNEENKLDSWLSDQRSIINTLADVLSSMEELADILTADQDEAYMTLEGQEDGPKTLEDQVVDTLKPMLKAVLDSNPTHFEVYMGFLDGTAVAGSGYNFDYSWWHAFERGWYKLALTDTSCAHITSPYVDAQSGELCITAVRAVINNGRLIGVVSADILVTELQNITLSATMDSLGYSMLIDTNGDILVHPDADYAPDADGEFRNLSTIKDGAYAELWNKISSSDGIYKYTDATGINKFYSSCTLLTTKWHMVTIIPTSVISKPIINVIMIVIPIAMIILIVAALLIFITVRNLITRPVAPLTTFMTQAGTTGDIRLRPEDIEIINKYSENGDEIGRCIKGSAAFVVHMTEVGSVLEKISNGDLTVELPLLSDDDVMGKSLRTMVNNLGNMFKEINVSTGQVSLGAKQIADGAQSLAQGSSEQAATIEELSSAIGDIAQKSKTNADTAEKTARLAETIKGSAEKGSRQMDEMISAVKEINDASQSIGKIIKTIDDIAFQTNILALNAAVEAARAGSAGKGFAVVAEEVRNLASKSAEAAKDTGAIIQDSMDKAELGVRIAGETAASLGEIVSGINESTQLIGEIARASEEQSVNTKDINTGIDQVAQVVQQNSATAEESSAASVEMSTLSNMLRELISQFKFKM